MTNKLKTISEEIISRAIEGDVEAFTEIYQIYNQRVFFLAVQYFKNEATAKDIVQEVFIKVYKNIHTLKSTNAFSSWLHTITYRECQNYNRKKLKIYDLKDDESIEGFPDITAIDIASQVENERIKEIIMKSLDTMKKPLRTVAVLRFFEEMKIHEIAEILNVPNDTVKSRIRRIRKKLSTDLEKNGVSKNFGFTLVSPLIFEAYSMLCEKYKMNDITSEQILRIILTGGGASIGGISILTKLLVGGLISTTAIGGTIIYNENESKQVEPEIEIVLPSIDDYIKHKEVATIDSISHDNSWTNEKVKIDIKTSNTNYDRILIDDMETLKVLDNGIYVVKLMKNNEVIDEEEIEISNIDRNSPTAVGEEVGNDYIISLNEDVSGIDWNSIEYYKNGTWSNDYQYDQNKNQIIVHNDILATHDLYVSDNAGNELSITLKVID